MKTEKLHLLSFYSCSCNEPHTTRGYNAAFKRGKCRCGAYQVRPLPKLPESEPFQYGGDMVDVF